MVMSQWGGRNSVADEGMYYSTVLVTCVRTVNWPCPGTCYITMETRGLSVMQADGTGGTEGEIQVEPQVVYT